MWECKDMDFVFSRRRPSLQRRVKGVCLDKQTRRFFELLYVTVRVNKWNMSCNIYVIAYSVSIGWVFFGSAGLNKRVWPGFRESISLANVPLCHYNTPLSWPMSRSVQSLPITAQHIWFMQASWKGKNYNLPGKLDWLCIFRGVRRRNKPPKPPFHAVRE